MIIIRAFYKGCTGVCIKGILAALILMLTHTAALSAAFPVEVGTREVSSASDIIYVTRPEQEKLKTYIQSFALAGYGRPGSEVALYRLRGGEYIPLLDKQSEHITFTVGASGMFWLTSDLEYGDNNLMLYAVSGKGKQIIKIQITLYNINLLDKITNDFKINAKDLLITD